MILQEIYKDDPWKMICGCILLNITTRKQVDAVRDRLFERYPDSLAMSQADLEELGELLRGLGLWRRRAETLKKFSTEWGELMLEMGERLPMPEVVHCCTGVGKYAVDSYKIFVLGWDMKPSDVEDKELKKYLESRAYLGMLERVTLD